MEPLSLSGRGVERGDVAIRPGSTMRYVTQFKEDLRPISGAHRSYDLSRKQILSARFSA